MFAWILKTKPLNFASSGVTGRAVVARARGGGAYWAKPFSISRTPKLPMAEPKYTGVSSPLR